MSTGKILRIVILIGALWFLANVLQHRYAFDAEVSVYEVAEELSIAQGKIVAFYQNKGRLPDSNEVAAVRSKPSSEKSLLSRLDVVDGGRIVLTFKANHDDKPVVAVFSPTIQGKYNLDWLCHSSNLNHFIKASIFPVCGVSDEYIDINTYVIKPTEQDYIKTVIAEQRSLMNSDETVDIEYCDSSKSVSKAPYFYTITDQILSYWHLNQAGLPAKVWEQAMPDGIIKEDEMVAYGEYLYFILNEKIFYKSPFSEGLIDSHIMMKGGVRIKLYDGVLYVGNGAGSILAINLCSPDYLKVKVRYLFSLGGGNQKNKDFYIKNGKVYFLTQQQYSLEQSSALSSFSLGDFSHRGFIKLPVNAEKLLIDDQRVYVANGSSGIDLVTVDKSGYLTHKTTHKSRDYAANLLIVDDKIVVADRLAGISIYQLEGTNFTLIGTMAVDKPIYSLSLLSKNRVLASGRLKHSILIDITYPQEPTIAYEF